MIVYLDFETRSKVPIGEGLANYVTEAEVLCLAWAVNDRDVRLWVPGDDPDPLFCAVKSAKAIVAHNATFERCVWDACMRTFYGAPELPITRWVCSMATARVNNMPASLDKLTRALNPQGYQKDQSGAALIRALCVPNAQGEFNEDPEKLSKLFAYCARDVEAMREAYGKLRPMSRTELADYHISEEINDRGVGVDIELATAAQGYMADEQHFADAEITALTDGAVTKASQIGRIKAYVSKRMAPDQLALITTDGKVSLDANARTALLDVKGLDPAVSAILQVVDGVNQSAVKKFAALLKLQQQGRIYDAFNYAGASQTLRFTSSGAQLHNFKRDCYTPEEAEKAKALILEGYELPDGVGSLAKLLRPALIPAKGSVFVVADWSAVEGRALPWLARSFGGEDVLDVFRRDEDIYLHACKSLGLPDTDRQIGKVATLALGYGGGEGAFTTFGQMYGVSVDNPGRIIAAWRNANPWAVELWNRLSRASLDAVRSPGIRCPATPDIDFIYEPEALGGLGALYCKVTGGLILTYPAPEVEKGAYGPEVSIMKTSANIPANAKVWPRARLWGGHLAENITQAVCAALLRDALAVLDHEGLKVVMHVHDEIVCECTPKEAERVSGLLKEIMEEPQEWADGLPLKTAPIIMSRYGKH